MQVVYIAKIYQINQLKPSLIESLARASTLTSLCCESFLLSVEFLDELGSLGSAHRDQLWPLISSTWYILADLTNCLHPSTLRLCLCSTSSPDIRTETTRQTPTFIWPTFPVQICLEIFLHYYPIIYKSSTCQLTRDWQNTLKMTANLRQTPLTCSGHTRPVVFLAFSEFNPEDTSNYFCISACKGKHETYVLHTLAFNGLEFIYSDNDFFNVWQ